MFDIPALILRHTLPGGLEQVRQIATHGQVDGVLFVLNNGQLASTVSNSLPRLVARDFPRNLKGVKRASLGGAQALALLDDGRVLAWGSNQHGQTEVPASLPPAVNVAAGISNSFAVHLDGSVSGWGRIPAEWNLAALTEVTDLVVLLNGLVALRRDGTLLNQYGERVPNLDRVVQLIIGPGNSCYALTVSRVGAVQRSVPYHVFRAEESVTLAPAI